MSSVPLVNNHSKTILLEQVVLRNAVDKGLNWVWGKFTLRVHGFGCDNRLSFPKKAFFGRSPVDSVSILVTKVLKGLVEVVHAVIAPDDVPHLRDRERQNHLVNSLFPVLGNRDGPNVLKKFLISWLRLFVLFLFDLGLSRLLLGLGGFASWFFGGSFFATMLHDFVNRGLKVSDFKINVSNVTQDPVVRLIYLVHFFVKHGLESLECLRKVHVFD